MGRNVRFIILNREEAFAEELRALLAELKNVKVVAEVDEPALLSQAVQQFPVDVLLVNLDPNPDALLPIVRDITEANRELAVFAASSSTDGQLILKTYRLGVREFVPKPIDATLLQEAIDRIAVQQSNAPVQGKLVTVIGSSGGVGATLIATNIAAELAALAQGTVTIVDLDYRFGQVATFLDVDPKYTIADLCGSPEALEPQVISRALTRHDCGLQVLARPNQLAESETITAAACMGVFSNLMQLNEYVVSDGPTRFDPAGKPVLAFSDVTLLIVQQQVPCVRNAQRIIGGLRDDGINLDRTRLICNRIGREAGHLSVSDVTDTLGMQAFASIPDDWEAASGAINLGEPLLSHSPKSKLRIAIQEIAERLHNPDAGADEKDDRKRGLLDRIFAGG